MTKCSFFLNIFFKNRKGFLIIILCVYAGYLPLKMQIYWSLIMPISPLDTLVGLYAATETDQAFRYSVTILCIIQFQNSFSYSSSGLISLFLGDFCSITERRVIGFIIIGSLLASHGIRLDCFKMGLKLGFFSISCFEIETESKPVLLDNVN